MSKITIFILLLVLGFSITASPADAAFWSKWFNKGKQVETEQTQEVQKTEKVSLWSRMVNFFSEPKVEIETEAEVEEEPALDIVATQNKIKTIENIVNGKHLGKKDINISFTQEELTEVVLPYINREISKNNTSGNNIVINDINLLNGPIEITSTVEKPINGEVYIKFTPSTYENKTRIDIQKIKFKKIPVPKGILDNILKTLEVKLDMAAYPIPNSILTQITINENEIRIKGKYLK